MKTIFRFELRRGRTTTIIFTAICTGLLIFVMALYPLMKDMLSEMTDTMADMGAFSEAFSMDELNYGSAQDYFATEGGMALTLCGAILASFLGGGMLGREESEHTGEWLLTHPVSRRRIFLGKFLAMAVLLLVLNLVCGVLTGLSFPIIGEPLNLKTFSLFFIAQYIMQMEMGCIALLLSASMRRSAGPLGLGLSLVLYFVSLIAAAFDEVKFITYITPFTYADAASIFTEGSLDMLRVGIGMGIMLLCALAACTKWNKKDIAA